MSLRDVAAEAERTGRTRIIIHDHDLDHPLGFVHAKDLLRLPDGTWKTTTARSMVRPMMVTPEQHRLEDLLVEMRMQRRHISVVADEHGTVVGLVTLEDVFEELIGDFHDESDHRTGECIQNADGTYTMNGSLRPDQFEDITGAELPDGDWQTVAGYVINELDDIPEAGDSVATDVGEFTVLQMDGFAIASLQVRLNASTETGTDVRQGGPEPD